MDDDPIGPNAAQRAEWNGASGARWLSNQARLEAALLPFGAAAMEAALPRPGERVLDVGCGCGPTTLELARRVGANADGEPNGGAVTGIDISAQLIDEARRRAATAGLEVRFLCADAATEPFPADAFELLFSRFGLMFFDDPPSGFGHLRQALRAGGRLTFVCWRGPADNPWLTLPLVAAAPLLAAEPASDPDAPGPFALARAERIRSVLAQAGFAAHSITPFDAPMRIGRGATVDAALDDAVAHATLTGPLARRLPDIAEPERGHMLAAVRAALTPHARAMDGERGAEVSLPAAAWIVQARP